MSNSFHLTTNFKPTGDQPQAIKKLVSNINNGHKHQTLMGVTGSGKTFTLANVIQQLNRPTLVISHNKTLAAQTYQELRDFFPQNAVSYFVSYYDYYQPESYIPSTDTYIEKETDINDEIDKLRLSTTSNLLTRPDVIVVASVSCIYNLGSPLNYAKNLLELIPGQIIDPHTIIKRLIDMQYTRNQYDLCRGDLRVKGDTIQLWPANLNHALELSFLNNLLEAITPIDPITFQQIDISTSNLPHPSPVHTIYPAKHFQSNKDNQSEIFVTIKNDLARRLEIFKSQGKIVEAYRLAQRVKNDLEMIKELGYVNGIENYSRYFDGRKPGEPPYSLLDYFSHNIKQFNLQNFITIIDESHITVPQLKGMYRGDKSRKQTLIDFGFRLPSALDNRPLKLQETIERMPSIIYASATPAEWELSQSKNHVAEQLIRPTGLIDPQIIIKSSKNQIPDLISEITKRTQKGQRTLVTTLTKRTAEALTEYLNDPKMIKKALYSASSPPLKGGVRGGENQQLPRVQYLHADVKTLDRSDILDSLRQGEFDVVVGINLLREGLDLPEVSLVAILEADHEGFLRTKTTLIQTMGRAARHQEGTVILYADRKSKAMIAAITEVNRRRKIQQEYNRRHHISPQSIKKPIRQKLLDRQPHELSSNFKTLNDLGIQNPSDIDPDSLTPSDKNKLIKLLTKQMNQTASDWDFEQAATLRDIIKTLQKP